MANSYVSNLDYRPQNITDQISDILKKAIINNELKGGQQIVELQLQKKLGVSRSPIREAFRELEKLGLVKIIPRKGTYVKEISLQDIRENYQVRAPLEGLAAKQAATLMDDTDREKLQETLSDMDTAFLKEDIPAYWRGHKIFHNTFIYASGNILLINILQMLRIHSVRHRNTFPNFNEDLKESLKLHEKIFKLFFDKDSDKDYLEKFVTQHILDVFPLFIENIEKSRLNKNVR